VGSSGRSLSPQLPSNVLEGVPLVGYGESYLAEFASMSSSRYFERLYNRIRSTNGLAAANRGFGSSFAIEHSLFATGTQTIVTGGSPAVAVAGTWVNTLWGGGVVVIDSLRNDAGYDNDNTVKRRRGATNGLDALLRIIRAQSRTAETNAAFVYTGAWTAQATTSYSSGAAKYTTTVGDKVVITTPVGTDFDVLLVCMDSLIGLTGAAFTVKIDGVNQPALAGTTNDQLLTQRAVLGAGLAPLAVPVRGLANAVHTIEIAHAGAGGQYLYVDDLLIQASTAQPAQLSVRCRK
jgi:hypothetical protein